VGVEPTVADLQSDAIPTNSRGKLHVSPDVAVNGQRANEKSVDPDPRLQLILDRWPVLPEPIRAGILAMVNAVNSTGKG